jgi:hypothetical protein
MPYVHVPSGLTAWSKGIAFAELERCLRDEIVIDGAIDDRICWQGRFPLTASQRLSRNACGLGGMVAPDPIWVEFEGREARKSRWKVATEAYNPCIAIPRSIAILLPKPPKKYYI